MRSIIAVLLGVLSFVAPMARGQYIYITNNGAITITGYTGPGGFTVIPSTINGLPVTSIGDNAFLATPTNSLHDVSIPDSVTNIGNGAFDGNPLVLTTSLGKGVVSIGAYAFRGAYPTSLFTLPNSLVSLGDGAFQSASLSTITIPASVTNIGANPFAGCPLTSINVKTNNPAYVSIDGVLLNKNQTSLIGYPAQKSGNYYVISNTVTSIGAIAFDNNLLLSGVTIPPNVTSIGSNAFAGSYITNISIPYSVTNIGPNPFFACVVLKAIDVDSNNPSYISVDDVLFDQGLRNVICYPAGKTNISYVIPDTVTNIGDGAFFTSSHLQNITIPHGVLNIGYGAFGAGALTNLIIPDSVTSIGNYAFVGQSRLRNIVVPASVTNLGGSAFQQCTSLLGAYFGGNALMVDPTVFSGASRATVYYLPGTTGWGPTFGGAPTAIWKPAIQTNDGFLGVRNGQFCFNISWASNYTVTVQANGDLTGTNWTSLQTNTLTNGVFYFSDPDSANHPNRFYRVSYP